MLNATAVYTDVVLLLLLFHKLGYPCWCRWMDKTRQSQIQPKIERFMCIRESKGQECVGRGNEFIGFLKFFEFSQFILSSFIGHKLKTYHMFVCAFSQMSLCNVLSNIPNKQALETRNVLKDEIWFNFCSSSENAFFANIFHSPLKRKSFLFNRLLFKYWNLLLLLFVRFNDRIKCWKWALKSSKINGKSQKSVV